MTGSSVCCTSSSCHTLATKAAAQAALVTEKLPLEYTVTELYLHSLLSVDILTSGCSSTGSTSSSCHTSASVQPGAERRSASQHGQRRDAHAAGWYAPRRLFNLHTRTQNLIKILLFDFDRSFACRNSGCRFFYILYIYCYIQIGFHSDLYIVGSRH